MQRIKYKQILESVSDWIWEVDADDRYTYCSESVYDFLGFTIDEVIGKKPCDFMSENEAKRVQTIIDKAIANHEQIIAFKSTLMHKNGSEIFVETNAIPILDEEGNFLGYQGIDRNITEFTGLKKTLHEKNAMLREQFLTLDSVINATDDLIFYKDYLHSDGTYLGCNEAYTKFIGKPKEEIIGCTDFELFGQMTGAIYRNIDKEILSKKQTQTNEVCISYPNGENKLVSSSKAPFYNDNGEILGVVGIARDITQQHENTLALSKQKELYDLVFNNTTSGIILIDAENMKFLDCNEAMVNMLQADSKDDVLQLTPIEISPPFQADGKASQEKIVEATLLARSYGSYTFEWQYINKTNKSLWAEVTLTLITLNDKEVFYAILKDISIQKKAESELDHKHNMMIQQARYASMGEMIGNISHQWRQPLNALGLTIQKLPIYYQRDMLDLEKLTSSVDKSMQLIKNMSSTIDDFRNFFNPNKEKVTFKISEAIDKSYAIVQAAYDQKNINFSLDVEDPELSMTGYPNELSQVIVNLLVNAKDVLLERSIDNPFVKISLKEEKSSIYIKVNDNGGGIPASNLSKVFEPYFTTKAEGQGTGVGLYMSKNIIENHMSGTLTLKNVDKGAQFTITLQKKSVENI